MFLRFTLTVTAFSVIQCAFWPDSFTILPLPDTNRAPPKIIENNGIDALLRRKAKQNKTSGDTGGNFYIASYGTRAHAKFPLLYTLRKLNSKFSRD